MAIRTKRYISEGGRVIRAVKVTERNFDDLIDWVNRNSDNLDKSKSVAAAAVAPNGDVSNQRLRLYLKGKGVRVARVGDYVAHILDEDTNKFEKEVFIIKGGIFEDKYSETKK